jgi:hypothetical protein
MTAVQEFYGSGNNNNGNGNGNGNNSNINIIPIIPAPNYFKLGSLTRRHSVIGCIGYEYANPPQKEEKEEKEEETKEKEEEKPKNSCAICLEQQEHDQTKNLATTPCGHTFCLTCLLGHLKYNNSCPLCRAPIEENAKKIVTPISYDEGVMLLNHELTSLRIEENIQEQVDALIEISGNPQTDGSNVSSIVDDLMVMVASFGFNLLYDAVCHMQNGEENVDPEWHYEMYGTDDDESGDDDDQDDDDEDDDDETEEGNLTTVSSSSSSDDDNKDDNEDDKVWWGDMYQLPPVDID